MSKPKAYELVIWEDPASEFDGWNRIDKMVATGIVEVYSVGWPVREDSTHLYLSMDWHDDECNTIGRIPLTAIKARKRINLRGFPAKTKKLSRKEEIRTHLALDSLEAAIEVPAAKFGQVPLKAEGEVEMLEGASIRASDSCGVT